MGNLKFLLVLAAICWLSLLLNMLGVFLKRFVFTRKLGVIIQWQAFILYLLGLGATGALCYFSIVERKDWQAIVLTVCVVTAVPLVAATIQFYRIARYRKKTEQAIE